MHSVLWRCWLGGRKGIRPVKTECLGAGLVICLERGADLHMAELMPLPLTVSCSSKIQIGFTFLVPAYPGCCCCCYWLTRVVPEKGPLNGCTFIDWHCLRALVIDTAAAVNDDDADNDVKVDSRREGLGRAACRGAREPGGWSVGGRSFNGGRSPGGRRSRGGDVALAAHSSVVVRPANVIARLWSAGRAQPRDAPAHCSHRTTTEIPRGK